MLWPECPRSRSPLPPVGGSLRAHVRYFGENPMGTCVCSQERAEGSQNATARPSGRQLHHTHKRRPILIIGAPLGLARATNTRRVRSKVGSVINVRFEQDRSSLQTIQSQFSHCTPSTLPIIAASASRGSCSLPWSLRHHFHTATRAPVGPG